MIDEELVEAQRFAAMSDTEVLNIATMVMNAEIEKELSDLMTLNSETGLSPTYKATLDTLIQHYEEMNVEKARALKWAVKRGLIPPLHS